MPANATGRRPALTSRLPVLIVLLAAARILHAEGPDQPKPTEPSLFPTLNLALPEGTTEIRLSKLVRSSMFQTQFEYDFVSGDIAAFLRYKYYGSTQSLTLSAFDTLSFRSIETVSQNFDRVRGLNALIRRLFSFETRLLILAEIDRLTFSNPQQNVDNNRTNVVLKAGYQYGTGEDEKANRISGDPNERIRQLFSAYRLIGYNGRALSAAVSWGTPAGNFSYVKAEGEAVQVLDAGNGVRIVGRLHAGLFPVKPYGQPDESSVGLPYRIPGGEFFHLDGRDALKGSKSSQRGVNEIHLTMEGFVPVIVNREIPFYKLSMNNLHAVGYLGFGNVGNDGGVFTRFGDYRQDVGVGFEASMSYRKYRVFVSALAARVLQDTGVPRFLLSVRSLN